MSGPVVRTQPAKKKLDMRPDYYGAVEIITDKWKTRQPMSGQWEYELGEFCWNFENLFLAVGFPCLYDGILTKQITQSSALGALLCMCPCWMFMVRKHVREGRKIEGSLCNDLLVSLFEFIKEYSREVLDYEAMMKPKRKKKKNMKKAANRVIEVNRASQPAQSVTSKPIGQPQDGQVCAPQCTAKEANVILAVSAFKETKQVPNSKLPPSRK